MKLKTKLLAAAMQRPASSPTRSPTARPREQVERHRRQRAQPRIVGNAAYSRGSYAAVRRIARWLGRPADDFYDFDDEPVGQGMGVTRSCLAISDRLRWPS